LNENVRGITGQVQRFFKRGEEYANGKSILGSTRLTGGSVRAGGVGRQVRVLNNLDWFGGMGFLEFLRDYGKLVRVGNMLSRDA